MCIYKQVVKLKEIVTTVKKIDYFLIQSSWPAIWIKKENIIIIEWATAISSLKWVKIQQQRIITNLICASDMPLTFCLMSAKAMPSSCWQFVIKLWIWKEVRLHKDMVQFWMAWVINGFCMQTVSFSLLLVDILSFDENLYANCNCWVCKLISQSGMNILTGT